MTIVEEGVSSVYAAPGQRGSIADYRPRYGHYIGGEFVEPIKGEYFENISPVNGARALATRYLGVELPFLPEKSAFSTWSRPYDFIPVEPVTYGPAIH